MKNVKPKKLISASPFNIKLFGSFKIKRGGNNWWGITVQITVNGRIDDKWKRYRYYFKDKTEKKSIHRGDNQVMNDKIYSRGSKTTNEYLLSLVWNMKIVGLNELIICTISHELFLSELLIIFLFIFFFIDYLGFFFS